MRDILKDWRRWSPAERLSAVVIAALMALGIPVVIAANFYLTAAGRIGPGMTGSF